MKNLKEEMLDALEWRLANVAKILVRGSKEEFKNDRIIEVSTLENFIETAMSSVSMLLGFKNCLNYEDSRTSIYRDLIIQGALLSALSSQALLECGREFVQYNDNGVKFDPPKVSEMLMKQWELEKSFYMQKIDVVREDIV